MRDGQGTARCRAGVTRAGGRAAAQGSVPRCSRRAPHLVGGGGRRVPHEVVELVEERKVRLRAAVQLHHLGDGLQRGCLGAGELDLGGLGALGPAGARGGGGGRDGERWAAG